MTNDHRLQTPDQIRNILAAAALHSARELRVYSSQGNTQYSTLEHTEKVVNFIKDATNINDTAALKQLVAIRDENTKNINFYSREKARLDKMAYEATLAQATVTSDDAKSAINSNQNLDENKKRTMLALENMEQANDAVQDWSEYETAAAEAEENKRKLIEINGIFELLFKDNIAEISEAMLQLPNIL